MQAKGFCRLHRLIDIEQADRPGELTQPEASVNANLRSNYLRARQITQNPADHDRVGAYAHGDRFRLNRDVANPGHQRYSVDCKSKLCVAWHDRSPAPLISNYYSYSSKRCQSERIRPNPQSSAPSGSVESAPVRRLGIPNWGRELGSVPSLALRQENAYDDRVLQRGISEKSMSSREWRPRFGSSGSTGRCAMLNDVLFRLRALLRAMRLSRISLMNSAFISSARFRNTLNQDCRAPRLFGVPAKNLEVWIK
jgi:hypothetical protein